MFQSPCPAPHPTFGHLLPTRSEERMFCGLCSLRFLLCKNKIRVQPSHPRLDVCPKKIKQLARFDKTASLAPDSLLPTLYPTRRPLATRTAGQPGGPPRRKIRAGVGMRLAGGGVTAAGRNGITTGRRKVSSGSGLDRMAMISRRKQIETGQAGSPFGPPPRSPFSARGPCRRITLLSAPGRNPDHERA